MLTISLAEISKRSFWSLHKHVSFSFSLIFSRITGQAQRFVPTRKNLFNKAKDDQQDPSCLFRNTSSKPRFWSSFRTPHSRITARSKWMNVTFCVTRPLVASENNASHNNTKINQRCSSRYQTEFYWTVVKTVTFSFFLLGAQNTRFFTFKGNVRGQWCGGMYVANSTSLANDALGFRRLLFGSVRTQQSTWEKKKRFAFCFLVRITVCHLRFAHYSTAPISFSLICDFDENTVTCLKSYAMFVSRRQPE